MVERGVVDRGRHAWTGRGGGLNPAPLQAKAKCPETHGFAALEILLVPRPKFGGFSCLRHVVLLLRRSPVGQRFAWTIVPALCLVGRSSDTPEKRFIEHG